MGLDATSESLLKFHFGRAATFQEGSPSGALLERALLYGSPLRKKPARDKQGKLVNDPELLEARKQWIAVRQSAKAYALGRETLIAFWGFCITERPWKAHQGCLPRVAAVYAEIDRLYAAWEAGAMPSEAGILRWIKRDVLPLRIATANEITARPTAETRTSNATEPAHRDLLRAAGASRALQRMARAGRVAEVNALEALYGAGGEHFLDQGLPRHWVLAARTQEGNRLLAKLPKSGAAVRWYEEWANHWHARDSINYEQYAVDFARVEIVCERFEERACRAWRVAREASGA